MTVSITLSGAGSSTGPTFNLFSSSNGTTYVPLATGISKTVLQSGYQATVPNGTTKIKVTSVGACTNSYDATIGVVPTTTTTTTAASTTTTTTTVGLAVGQNYQGGIIAYLDYEGGLIVAPNNLGSGIWGCAGTFVLNLAGDYLGALDTTVYGGQLNTQEIVGPNGCATLGIAARLCDSYSNGGYSDWYLANENEWFAIANSYVNPLNGIQNKDNPIFNFSNTSGYWTSNQSELNSAVAYIIGLNASPDAAALGSTNKNNTNLVRPIRKFTIV